MPLSELVESLLHKEWEEKELQRLRLQEADSEVLTEFRSVIGEEAFQTLLETENTRIYSSVDQVRMERVFVIKMLDRAVELVFRLSTQGALRPKVEINFAFWNEYLGSKKTAFLTSNKEKQDNSLAFLHALKKFLELMNDEVTVTIAGSDAQRARFWEKQVANLNKHGHLNIRLRKKV